VVACVPAFNEENTIGGVVVRAIKLVDRVVVCDDGSVDLTGDIAYGLGADVIRHEKNRGYGAALKSTFEKALSLGADVVVTLDGDGQHDPREITRLVEPFGKVDLDIVIGSRFLEGGGSNVPIWREAGIRFITGLTLNGKQEVTDAQSGFRAYSRRALKTLVLTEDGMGISTEILVKASENGLKVAEVPVNIKYDENSSTHNPIMHGLIVILSTVKYLSMKRPILFYGVPGFIGLLVASFFWIWTLQIYSVYGRIVTNLALIALSATVVSLMLLNTAIILWIFINILKEKVITNRY